MANGDSLKGLKDTIRDFLYTDLFPQRTSHDIVSSNVKVVLFGLFALIAFAVLTYAITITGNNYNLEDQSSSNESTELNDSQKLQRLQQLEQVNGVYIAAISGSLALGGTLIAQLWGRG